MTLQQQQSLFAQHVALLIQYIHAQGYTCTLGEAYRTPEQAKLNAAKGIGIANSLHTQRLAIDLNIFDPTGNLITDSNGYEWLGIYWESLDPLNRWGGYFVSKYGGRIVDGNHFERKKV